MRRYRHLLLSGLAFTFLLAVTREAIAQPPPSPPPKPEARSLFGAPLYPLGLSSEEKAKLEENLKLAQAEYDKDPKSADALIWLGRRLAYLHRYREAIDVYSKGLEIHPQDPRLYRHRGHRYITVREFGKASADFAKAASLIQGKADESEPSGTGGRPGTLHFNVWYHKALAHYLTGDFDKALDAYLECMKVSKADNESLVATSDWLYMTYRRLGKTEDAAKVLEPIQEDMGIKENTSYHRRLLMYKGKIAPESLVDIEKASDLDIATQGYGVGNWYLYTGQPAKAREVFTGVLQGKYWPAFGYIASEADLKRLK